MFVCLRDLRKPPERQREVCIALAALELPRAMLELHENTGAGGGHDLATRDLLLRRGRDTEVGSLAESAAPWHSKLRLSLHETK